MAWWGKLIGGTLGFMVGGPLGALLGASLGHSFDNREGLVLSDRIPSDRGRADRQERIQTAFFTATFSVMGKVSKADGQISASEIELANAVMREMQLDPEQRRLARALFNQGKADDFDFDGVMRQFKTECLRRTTLLRMFVEIQVEAALADRHLDPRENDVLRRVVQILGFPGSELERIINLVRGTHHAAEQAGKPPIADAYAVLGVTPDTPIEEIRKAYRRLRSQHHPDKLVSKGLPEEMIKLANDKTHEIQQAWETIREQRG